jgi:2-hydroxy-3-keto-5-methylthiopentenyl-1-phosphate phosphatase
VVKTLIQCDFDGTITEEDVSFLILDEYATRPWRPWLEKYKQGQISVGVFNTTAFSMVKADRQTISGLVRAKARIRPGFKELVDFCHQRDIEFVITSNGLDFYIEQILSELGINGIKINAARSEFDPDGMKVKYIGPDGNELLEEFKETHTRLYLGAGYRIIYIGNGASDLPPARLAYRVFACQDLLEACKEDRLDCIPFDDLHDVIRELPKII